MGHGGFRKNKILGGKNINLIGIVSSRSSLEVIQKRNISDLLTHRQIDKGKNVELDQDGEAQEDGIQQEHIHTQL